MGERGSVTRRTMLGQAAASGAAAFLSPGIALGAGGRRSISTRLIGSLHAVGDVVDPPRDALLAGVEWSSPRAAAIELRVKLAGGRWGPWVPASAHGHDADGLVGSPRFGEPLWIGHTAAVQLRSAAPVDGVRLHFISEPDHPVAGQAAAFSLAQPVLDAGPGQPPILARRGWAQGHAPPRALAGYGSVQMAFVHHTVSPNGYSAAQVPAMLRGIYVFHRYVRGMLDIAYNFLIDAYGRIWEGRAGGIDMAVIGAHAGGYNDESTGVAMLGTFSGAVPTPAALTNLKYLLAWKLSLHGIPTLGRAEVVVDPDSASDTPFRPGQQVSLPRIAGHRDGDLTDCPGDALYGRLPLIRRHAAALAVRPAHFTFTTPVGTVTAGQPVELSGMLTLFDGTPLANEPIEVQQLEFDPVAVIAVEQTIATTQTVADGSWSSSVTLDRNSILRVLHRPAPAAVADWTEVLVSPAIALTVLGTAPLQVAGTVSPNKVHVTVDLYATGQLDKPLAKRKVAASVGSFRATFANAAAGDYVVVARTAADRFSAAGASAPVSVTVS